MSGVRRFMCLWPVVGMMLAACSSNDSFVDSRALQNKKGSVVICHAGGDAAAAAGRQQAEKICQENWLPAPALMSSAPYSCALTAHVRDVYQCGGVAPVRAVDTAVAPMTSYKAISDQIMSSSVEEPEDDRWQLLSRGE